MQSLNNNNQVCYRLVYTPTIFDDGIEGFRGEDFSKYSAHKSDVQECDVEQTTASHQSSQNSLNRRNMGAEATGEGYKENSGVEQEPYLSIILDGTLVSKEMNDGSLCIPREVVEQVLCDLLYNGDSYKNQKNKSSRPQAYGSIQILCGRGQNKKQVHILFSRTNKDLRVCQIEYR